MDYAKPLNIIVSGLGGQGVFTLTKTLWRLCEINGIKCQSSTFKGGAQKHGSIHSVLRIFTEHYPDYAMFSTQIPKGDLDIIIGLEPWETLRYHSYFGANTQIFTNSRIVPFLKEQQKTVPHSDPVKALKNLHAYTTAKDYSALSMGKFSTGKMVNFLMGLDAVGAGGFPFTAKNYVGAFLSMTRPDKKLEKICHMALCA